MCKKGFKQQLYYNKIVKSFRSVGNLLLLFLDIVGILFIIFTGPETELYQKIVVLILVGLTFLGWIYQVFLGKEHNYLSTPMNVLRGHTYHINAISISNDGKYIASCGGDNRIIIWDKKTGKQIHQLNANGWVGNVKFKDFNNELIILTGKAGEVFTFDVTNLSEKRSNMCFGYSTGLEYHQGNIFVVGRSGKLTVIDISKPDWAVNEIQVSQNELRKISISIDGQIAFGGYDSNVYYMKNVQSRDYTVLFTVSEGAQIRDVVISLDGKMIGVADSNGNISLFSLELDKLLCTHKAHIGHAVCLTFSNKGNYVITGGQDKLIKIWKIKNKKLEKQFEIVGHEDFITDLEYDKDSLLWSSSRDKIINCWDLRGLENV